MLAHRATEADLHGKVVLVDVFLTFGCYNCANITPNLRTPLSSKQPAEFAMVGIHTPETPYERDRAAVTANLKRLGIVWPIAIDNEQRLWNAYGIEYWPTQLFFDRSGRLRKTVIGDSQDALCAQDRLRTYLALAAVRVTRWIKSPPIRLCRAS